MIGSLLFIESGWYNLAADTPHFAAVRWALLTMRNRAVRFHSRGIAVPDLADPTLAAHGFSLYRKNCQLCHGAPGDPRFIYIKFVSSTYAIPLRPGQMLPPIPATGFASKEAVAAVPGAKLMRWKRSVRCSASLCVCPRTSSITRLVSGNLLIARSGH